MKKVFAILTVAMISLTGCGGSDNIENTDNNSSDMAVSENEEKVLDEVLDEVLEEESEEVEEEISEEDELATLMEAENEVAMNLYSSVLDTYKHLILNKETPEFTYERDATNYNFMIMYANGDPDFMYYEFYDIDKNGIDELILTDGEGGRILDLYTVIDGQLVLVADSGERWSYKLNDDDTIRYRGSGGADDINETVYALEGSELVVYENQDYYISTTDMYLQDGQIWIDNPAEWTSLDISMTDKQPNSMPLSQWNGL